MKRSFSRLALVSALVGGCGIRPLTSADLYGAAGAGERSGTAGAAGLGGTTGVAGMTGVAGTGGIAGVAGASGGADATADAAVDQGTPDAPTSGCPTPCGSDQFCDELTNRCLSRTGAGMLSGTVIDPCDNSGTDALVGIAGQHLCSYVGKGSYFFSGLPLGRLKLAAAKEGYELYGTTVEIVPGGVVQDIRLVRIGDCDQPPAPACTCTDPSCTRQTP